MPENANVKAEVPQQPEVHNPVLNAHAMLDEAYGSGWSADHPEAVALYMQAIAMDKLATEVAEIREVFSSGSGAITVGIERT